MDVGATGAGGQVGDIVRGDASLNNLESADFFKLLITELGQQDPFEPMKNQDLLNQISSIRSMEESTKLTDTLGKLVTQGEDQAMTNFMLNQTLQGLALQSDMATGANLIGKEVTAKTRPAGADVTDPDVQWIETKGVVTGVRLVEGEVTLELDTGEDVNLMDIAYVGVPVAAIEVDSTADETTDEAGDGTGDTSVDGGDTQEA